MDRFLFFILLLSCISCQPKLDQVSLPILDVSENYPIRKVNIHDIADVEYIPLELTEHSMLSRDCSHFLISDHYIVTFSMSNGDIFFFNREGKFLWAFNKRGEGAEEYNCIILLAIDFEKKECFVSDGTNQFLVYSLKGDYKRRFSIPQKPFEELSVLYDYDEEFLIGYKGSFAYDINRGINKKPYCLIDKKTGLVSSIDYTNRKHISPTIHEEVVNVSGGISANRVTLPMMRPLMKNGSELLIADYASDTLWHFVNRKLLPIALRSPSVFETSPPIVLAPWLFTDSYLYFRLISMKYDPSDPFKYVHEGLKLVWDRRTGNVEKWKVLDLEYSSKEAMKIPSTYVGCSTEHNYGIGWYAVSNLLEKYVAGELKGNLKKIASNLKDDDNDVLVICKYK